MEEKKQEQHPQYFYFNDDGKLVVESNKGIWVDGEQYVKMFGNFSCNAKTMGMIISQLKNIPVLVSSFKQKHCCIDFESSECLLNPTKEQIGLIDVITKKDDIIEEKSKKVDELEKQAGEDGDRIHELKKSIENYNALPWYKRMFKKIEIK